MILSGDEIFALGTTQWNDRPSFTNELVEEDIDRKSWYITNVQVSLKVGQRFTTTDIHIQFFILQEKLLSNNYSLYLIFAKDTAIVKVFAEGFHHVQWADGVEGLSRDLHYNGFLDFKTLQVHEIYMRGTNFVVMLTFSDFFVYLSRILKFSTSTLSQVCV